MTNVSVTDTTCCSPRPVAQTNSNRVLGTEAVQINVAAYILLATRLRGKLYKPPAEGKEYVGFETGHGSSTQRIGDCSRSLGSADVAVL